MSVALGVTRMSLSTGTRNLLTDAASWVAGALILAAGLTHMDEIRALVRTELAAHVTPVETARAPTQTPASQRSRRNVVLKADATGHYFTSASVNGRPINVLVDTGATIVALSAEDADRVGVRLRASDFTGRVSTANGTARVARITLDRVEIGGITVRDVAATVSEPGVLKTSLLGMSFLSRLERVDMRQGTLSLVE